MGRRARTCTTSGQGLRTFTTSFFQAPGRLNLLELGGIRVVIDYCHNVDGMRQLADFVDRMMVDSQSKAGRIGSNAKQARVGRAIGVIGIPGDRRDEDQREYGALAATAFDEIIVREDKNLRGRQPGETAGNVVEGVRRREGTTALRASAAPRRCSTRCPRCGRRCGAPSPGDLVVCCVDDAVAVYREAMALAGQARGGTAFADPGELRRPRAEAPARRSASPRPLLQSRDERGQLGRDVDRPRAHRRQQLEHPFALLVAHQHDHPRASGRAPSAAGAGPVPLSSARSAAVSDS